MRGSLPSLREATASMRGSRFDNPRPLTCERIHLSLQKGKERPVSCCCCCFGMVDPSLTQEMLQRLLNRLDHIEVGVLKEQQVVSQEARNDLQALSSVVGNMERARQLEAEDSLIADALARAPRATPLQAVASHRGPGALPPPSAPAGQAAATDVTGQAEPSPAGSGGQKGGAFSNALVKARSPASTPPERFDIASPPPSAPLPCEARAAHIATGLLQRYQQGSLSAPTAAAFQSPEPARCTASTGSPPFHAGAPTPPGLPQKPS